jgi:hypothetical protein
MNGTDTNTGVGMAADFRFDFYEEVIVGSTNPALSEIHDELGAVLGRACGEDGRWYYSVSIYRTGLCWFCMEDDLRPTGKFDRRESFFDGSSVRISQRGELLERNPPNSAIDQV